MGSGERNHLASSGGPKRYIRKTKGGAAVAMAFLNLELFAKLSAVKLSLSPAVSSVGA